MDYHVCVLEIAEAGDSAWRVVVERPAGYAIERGHLVELAIDEAGWWDKPRPLSLRRITEDDELEFVFFLNDDSDPVVRRMSKMRKGDHVVISEPVWEDIPDIFFGGWRRPERVDPAAITKSRVA